MNKIRLRKMNLEPSAAVLWCIAAAILLLFLGLSTTVISVAGAAETGPAAKPSPKSFYVIKQSMYETVKKNAFPEVNTLVEKYYQSIADGDVDGYAACVDTASEEEMEQLRTSAAVYEQYQDISCYTKPGITEDSFFVFTTYSLKFAYVDTAAPGFSAMYVYRDDTGEWKVFNQAATEEMLEAAGRAAEDPAVKAVREAVGAAYAEAKAADPALQELEKELE